MRKKSFIWFRYLLSEHILCIMLSIYLSRKNCHFFGQVSQHSSTCSKILQIAILNHISCFPRRIWNSLNILNITTKMLFFNNLGSVSSEYFCTSDSKFDHTHHSWTKFIVNEFWILFMSSARLSRLLFLSYLWVNINNPILNYGCSKLL